MRERSSLAEERDEILEENKALKDTIVDSEAKIDELMWDRKLGLDLENKLLKQELKEMLGMLAATP